MTEQVINNIASNPTAFKDIITIIFYTVGILFILSVVAKFFVKSECSNAITRIDNLEKKMDTEINMIKEDNTKREKELEKIYELLMEIKIDIPIMLNEIRSKIIGREDLENLISNKLLNHKDTCVIRHNSSK